MLRGTAAAEPHVYGAAHVYGGGKIVAETETTCSGQKLLCVWGGGRIIFH